MDMNIPNKTFPWTVLIGLMLLVLVLALAVIAGRIGSKRLGTGELPVYGTVADFSLTNQSGSAVSLADFRGKVWVADIIFTRCPGPCLRMTRQMKEIQQALPAGGDTRLVSLTTDPDFDSPAVLAAYAERFDADTRRWTFLTGTKKELGQLAVGSLKLSAVEKAAADRESENDLFVHSTIFVLVDRQGRLRGVFQSAGEGVDWPESKEQILAAVRKLEEER